MSQENAELVRALIPTPETDVAALFRDESLFQAARETLGDLFDPAFGSVARWEAGGTTYAGMEGFRRLWLEWLQPWATYHIHVDDLIDAGDRMVVLARAVAAVMTWKPKSSSSRVRCGLLEMPSSFGSSSAAIGPRPSKSPACRSRTLTPTPEAAGYCAGDVAGRAGLASRQT
jgi:hypothetical protein